MKNKKFIRKKVFVDRKFQMKFLGNIFMAILLIMILLAIFFIYSTSSEMKGSVYSKIVKIKNTNEIIMPVVIRVSLLILLFGGSIALYKLLRYSHQIIGPMVRFKRYLKNLGNGDFTISLKFRKRDELQDLADLLTKTSKKLNKRISSIKKHFFILRKLVKEKGIKRINNKEIRLLEDSIDTIEFILKDFKTD